MKAPSLYPLLSLSLPTRRFLELFPPFDRLQNLREYFHLLRGFSYSLHFFLLLNFRAVVNQI